MVKSGNLKPCLRQAGRASWSRTSRHASRSVHFRACGWSTHAVKLVAVAVKLWNEAKREGVTGRAAQTS